MTENSSTCGRYYRLYQMSAIFTILLDSYHSAAQ